MYATVDAAQAIQEYEILRSQKKLHELQCPGLYESYAIPAARSPV